MIESTLFVVKPHAVERGLVGPILGRLERAGLEIEDIKMIKGDPDLWDRFYPNDEQWFQQVGEKTLDSCRANGVDVLERLGTDDANAIGHMVKGWLVENMAAGRPVAVILSGNDARSKVRLLCGATLPNRAVPGTIRFDFSCDSPDLANEEKRPVFNLVHASDPEEFRDGVASADYEIGVLFG